MQDKMKKILDELETNIYMTDARTHKILFMNKRMKADYNIQSPEGKCCWEVLQQGQDGPCEFCKIKELIEEKKERIRWEEKNSKVGRVFDNYDSLFEINNQLIHMQQSFDITEYLELSRQKEKDELCNVWNRTKGKGMLEERLKHMADSGHSYLLVLLDTDNIKGVNENYGYGEGDFFLQRTAQIAKESLREEDFIFRLSGDEFIVVMEDTKVAEGTKKILKWRKLLEEEEKKLKKPYRMSFCYGTNYVTASNTLQVNDLIAQADEKMYSEKLRKRKNYAVKMNPFRSNSHEAGEMEYPSKFLYEALVNSSDDFIYFCDMKTGLFRYPPAQVEMFDLPGEIVGDTLSHWKKIVHPEDWERFYKSNMEIGEDKADYHSIEFRARKRSGEYTWIRCKGQLIRDEYGKPSFFAGIMKLLGQQNKVDPLTQLLNHAEFMKAVERNIQDEMVEQMAVILLDIDDFHQINELYSRSLGDEVLKILSQAIQAILPDNAALYRMEKDCMGIILENGDTLQAEYLYRMIQKHIMRMREWQQKKLTIEVSAGCSMYPHDGKNAEELYRYAAFTLQEAKKQGKNQLLFFSDEILENKSRFIRLVRQLREDVSRNYRGFYVDYQPQADTKTKEIVGVEALMRWRDIQGKLVSPGEFIPVMEENAMIYNAGLWMIQKVLKDSKEWIAIRPNFTVSVNISALQLLEDSFLEDLYRVIEEEKFPFENLILELTESYTVKNMNTFWKKFSRLRERGIRIAIDDFGTGYSSLGVLKNAPIDIVKIDKTFVKDILRSHFDATFISFVVAICHEANIAVYQEGVETEEEYHFLHNMKLDCIQGYYFGKPMSKQHITEKLQKHQERHWHNKTQEVDCDYFHTNQGFIVETAKKEKDFYQAMLSETAAYAEVDVERGCLMKAGGLWEEYFSAKGCQRESFSQIVECGILQNTLPENREEYRSYLDIENMKKQYREGNYTRKYCFQSMQDYTLCWMELTVHVFQEGDTGNMYALLYLKNIDSAKKRELEQEMAAMRDPLTNVFNRRSFEQEVNSFMLGEKDAFGAMLLVDMDDFKKINDTYGHLKGDEVLQKLTDVLMSTFRRKDVIGRLGGDEFVVFVKGVKKREVLDRRMEQFYEALQMLEDCSITCSAGIAIAEQEGFSYQETLRQADEALYHSKQNGKNRYCYYEKER